MGMFDGIVSSVGDVSKTSLSSLAGGLIGGVGSYFGQQSANQANAAQSQSQMDFQERMRSNSYQTAVDDMKKAGLNPMLAYAQGGATTPVGATTQVQNALGAGVTSGQQAYQLSLNTQQNLADIALKREQAGAAGSQEDLNRANMNLSLVEAANKSAQLPGHKQFVDQVASQVRLNNAISANNSANTAKTQFEMPEAKAIGELYKGSKGVYIKGAERGANVFRDLGLGVGSASSAVRNMGKKPPRNNYPSYFDNGN
jgi:hypothetical protein